MTLIKNAKVGGRTVDVRVGRTIVEIGQGLAHDTVVDVAGGELLPGFHDHHLHFLATAAARSSLDCGPPRVTTRQALAQAFGRAPRGGWLRGVGYHESVAGEIDRFVVDDFASDVPVRIQHRSGKLWVVNSLGCEILQLAEAEGVAGIERNADGVPTGRLFRLDGWLRERLGRDQNGPQRFADLSKHMASLGITGFTDASFTNDGETLRVFQQAHQAGDLKQKFSLMGDASLEFGYRKIMLDEDALPALDGLTADVREAHAQGRNVAFHCVSHIELLFALAALGGLPKRPGDRIEHASIIRDDVIDAIVASGVTIVTQPGFLTTRGDEYLADLSPDEVGCLYRYGALRRAGVPVVASSDAPYGPLAPLAVAQAAHTRRSPSGIVIGADEQVAAGDALASYFSWAASPCGPRRTVALGQPADLCVVALPSTVTHTFVDGELIYCASD